MPSEALPQAEGLRPVSRGDAEFIGTALTRFKEAQDSMSRIHEDGMDDDSFAGGNQWPEKLLKDREQDRRPSLVINRIYNFINRVVNDNRMNRPQIRVRPVDDAADIETAKVKNGILHHISSNSMADLAYDTAMDHAATHGFGYIRVLTGYQDDNSFEQDIIIDRIENSYSVYFPLHLIHGATWEDAPYLFVIKDISRDEYDATYGKTHPIGEWERTPNSGLAEWLTAKTVRLAEYFVKEETDITIYKTADGTTSETQPQDGGEYKSRRAKKVVWKWYLLTSVAILDTKVWPCKYPPVIPVLGKEIIYDGEKHYVSLTRFSKDPQRMLNYWRSSETEFIALAPRAPFVGYFGQFEGLEDVWKTANSKNHAYLQVRPIVDAATGSILPIPQRVQPVQIPTGYANAAKEAADDIKSVLGIFDASLGAQGSETSGRAIISRQRQSDIANFHFADNFSRSLRQVCKVVLELIPVIIDTPRTVRIIGEDKEDRVVKVNQRYFENGKEINYDMSGGKYDLTVDVGPSYATKRQESLDAMLQFVQANPPAGAIMGDLIAKAADFEYAQEISERIKRTMPPQIVGGEEGQSGEPPIDPKQVAMLIQEYKQMEQENAQLKAALGDKTHDRRLKFDTEMLKTTAAVDIARMRAAERNGMQRGQMPAPPDAGGMGSGQAPAQPSGQMTV